MIVSVVSTYCSPAGPSISATSSVRLSAPGPASGAKKRAMRSNSPSGGVGGLVIPQALGADRAGKAIEHAVHQSGLLAGKEGMSNIEIFADDDARRHTRPCQKLIHGNAQDRAEDDLQPLERPIGGEHRGNAAIDIHAPCRGAFDQFGEKLVVGVAEAFIRRIAAEVVAGEFDDRRRR